MLEKYFVKPATIDRIRGSWIAAEIESYVVWLVEQGYSTKSIWRRVPIAFAFGEFARARGASTIGELACACRGVRGRPRRAPRRTHWVDAADGEGGPGPGRADALGRTRLVSSPAAGRTTPSPSPMSCPASSTTWSRSVVFARPRCSAIAITSTASRPTSDGSVSESIRELSPAILSAFVVERAAAGLAKSTVRDGAGVLRVFLRYAHREGVLATDLSAAVGWPQVYRLSNIPRSISWDDVNRVLAGVDRRTEAGRRDYAILLLLVTYGLRGREVAALTLDDIDWKRERLAIPERKAGHSTAFPLSAVVGEALRRLPPAWPSRDDRSPRVLPGRGSPPADRGCRGVLAGPPLPAQGGCRRSPAGVAHPAPLGGAAPRRCELRPEDHRRLRRAPLGALDRGLRQGRRRGAARGRPGRRRGGPVMNDSLAAAVADFLAHKRALGRKYRTEEATLRLLLAFADQHGVDDLRPAHTPPARRVRRLQAQAAGPQLQPPRRDPRLLPRLGRHPAAPGGVAAAQDPATGDRLSGCPSSSTPPRPASCSRRPRHFPTTRRATGRGPTYHAIFALCYGLGLRAGEACGLRLGDVDADRQLLVVRGGKFGKSRLVPHGPRIGELLARQVERRRVAGAQPNPTHRCSASTVGAA